MDADNHLFYDEDELGSVQETPHLLRPCRILHFYMKRRMRRNSMMKDDVTDEVINRTGLTSEEISTILSDTPPTPNQMGKLMRGMKWSIWFLLGIREVDFDQTFLNFCAAGSLPPTTAVRRAFAALYRRCLEQKLAAEGEGRGGNA